MPKCRGHPVGYPRCLQVMYDSTSGNQQRTQMQENLQPAIQLKY